MTTLTGFEQDRDGVFIRKSPTDVLDYSVDWTDWLPAGNTVSTSTFTVSTISGDTSPLTIDSQSNSGTKSTVFLSGGSDDSVYTVTCTITTTNTLTVARQFRILVEPRSV